MLIGIDASRIAKRERTGTEEYSYQLVKHLAEIDQKNDYVLYSSKKLPEEFSKGLPKNFKTNIIPLPKLWSQVRLSLEMLLRPPDVLFVPAHVLPLIHVKKSVVTIHGLEYEYFPEAYSGFALWYLRFSTKFALKYAKRIIAVSKNTKNDLIKFYRADPRKIRVIYHGFGNFGFDPMSDEEFFSKFDLKKGKYFLYLGRLEKRKNIINLIKAYNLFRNKFGNYLKLVLGGNAGYGYEEIKDEIGKSKYRRDIVETGFISNSQKNSFFKNAAVFVYPTFYEGFGLPILESFFAETPVVCGRVASLPEIASDAAIYIVPESEISIAKGMMRAISLREKLLQPMKMQLKKFSWKKSAEETLDCLEGWN
ncbi:MAG: glycosyl transferase, group 1 [uncultured bacterium]|nr:MAG: glycosyl transferase, group 1 [uncultured bacterium]